MTEETQGTTEARHIEPRNQDLSRVIDSLSDFTASMVFYKGRTPQPEDTPSFAEQELVPARALVASPHAQLSEEQKERFHHYVEAVYEYFAPRDLFDTDPGYAARVQAEEITKLKAPLHIHPAGLRGEVLYALAQSYARIKGVTAWEDLSHDLGLRSASEFNHVGDERDIIIRFMLGRARNGDENLFPEERQYRKTP